MTITIPTWVLWGLGILSLPLIYILLMALTAGLIIVKDMLFNK